MKTPLTERAIALTLLHSVLVAAQIATGTGSTRASSEIQPLFPIPANSSMLFTDSITSSVLLATRITISSNASITNAPSSSDTNTLLPETSTWSDLSSIPSLTPTATLSLGTWGTNTTHMLSSTISGVETAYSVTTSARYASNISDSRTRSMFDSPSSTDSILRPPEITQTSSDSAGTALLPETTLTPSLSTTLLPTGTEVQSSASDLSVVIVGAFPHIQRWIDNPSGSGIIAVTNELDNILPQAIDLLSKLPQPTNGVEPCKSGRRRRSESESVAVQTLDKRSFLGGLFKTTFSLVTCIIDTTNKVKDTVTKGSTDAVAIVKKLQDDLKPMVEALKEVDPDESPKPSSLASERHTSTQSDLPSSSSCTLQTVSNCKIDCTVIATTTLGGQKKRAKEDACTTACGLPITRCGATGVTSVSTTTSTTTSYHICAQDCAGCNANNRNFPTNAPNLEAYLKASNGVLYLPAPTVTALEGDSPGAEPKELRPRETGSPSSNFLKRGLTSPHDATYNGNVDLWLGMQIGLGRNNLAHGIPPITTTGFTFPLNNEPDTWHLLDLYGCTSVIVISRKRMFMTHIWEDPTMLTPQNLQPQVLDSLRNGDAGVPQGLTAFTGPGGDFENIPANKVRAFIITPYRRGGPATQSDDVQFPYEVGKIKDLLTNILGRSDTITIPYVARGPDPFNVNPFGKVLIQYDAVAAWLGRADGSCNTQVAGIELWFENNPRHRYRDRWTAFPNQLLPVNPLPRRSISGNGKDIRLLRGREVTDADEEEWKEYGVLMQRQESGFCSLPSKSASASSTSPSSSVIQDRTTFQTSFVSSSVGGDTVLSDGPPSSTKEFPTTTEEPRSSIKNPPASIPTTAPAPMPAPSKAVSIILKNVNDNGDDYNSWTFFETLVGSQADGCKVPVLNDPATRWSDRDALNNPPWPHGTFTLPLFGEDNCQYLNDGTGAGILHCPAMGEGNNVGCKEDSEKSQLSAITQCLYSQKISRAYHRVVFCEY